MESSDLGSRQHLLPEFVALFQAVDALRSRLLQSSNHEGTLPDAVPHLDHPARGPEPRFHATFFGGFALYRDGRQIDLGQQWCCLELCRYLIAHSGRFVLRDELLELLWPDAEAPGMHRLHVAVSSLRRMVDPPESTRSLIALEGECYGVPATMIDTDARRFDRSFAEAKQCLARGDSVAAAAAFRTAIALYHGDFLADHPYAEWTHLLRDHFRERRLVALAVLCDEAARTRDHRAVIDLASDILAADNLREQAHRHIMRARYYSGERGLAIRQYETCSRLLKTELGVSPSSQTRQLYEAILDDGDLADELSTVP